MAALLLEAASTRTLKVVVAVVFSNFLSVKAAARVHAATRTAAEGRANAVVIRETKNLGEAKRAGRVQIIYQRMTSISHIL
jgi:hypothetical protein